jgi:1-acyl-sn-glycerol-3-phosphate acyltransferase
MRCALISVWTWFVIVAVSILSCVIQVLLFLPLWPFDKQRAVIGRIFRLAAVASAKLAPTWNFSIYGKYPSKTPGRTVVVSNHVSNADAFLISHLPWEMKWLGKSSLFKVPFIGWAMHLAGDIQMTRGSRHSVEKALRRCAQYLKNNMPVFIFPEGTRSRDGQLGAFKDGAFRLAIENEAHILPLAVYGTQSALPVYSWRLGPSRAFVAVGKPISTNGMTLADLDHLKSETRQQIEQLLTQLKRL